MCMGNRESFFLAFRAVVTRSPTHNNLANACLAPRAWLVGLAEHIQILLVISDFTDGVSVYAKRGSSVLQAFPECLANTSV